MKNLFTVVIAGSQYLLHPQKLGTIEETINPDALIPVTLLTTSEINTDLEGILELFATVDDVFQPDFGGILVEKPEKNKTIGLAHNPVPRSRAVFSLQRPEAEVTAFEDLPSGPYFLHGPNLYQAWRLYDDILDAFTFGVIPNSINGSDDGYEALSSLSDNGSSKSIAVPSRLYHAAPSIRKPLSGVRISVTDAVSLKGVQTTLSSRSWTQLYGAEASETAEFAQKLIDMGAVIVGKTKSSQLDSGREWVDVAAPWNPRGDGYLDSGGSAAGAGASVSGYDWMEYAIAKDAFEGVREQARVHGVYSIRASANAASLQGWRNDSQNYAAVGLLNRNLHDLLSIAQLTFNTSNTNMPFPKRIIYPLDFASTAEGDQALDDKFVAMLEHFLGVKADKIRLSDAWDADPPNQANGQSLEEYMKEAPFSSFCYDFYQENQDFRNGYKNKFGREPYVEATPRFRWGIGANESKHDYTLHRERIEVFNKWFGDTIMSTLGDSGTIMVIPIGPYIVQYRDDLPLPPSRIDGIGPEALAPLLGLPHLVIPFAQTPYYSRVTNKGESRPFSGSIMGPHGSDIMILQLAKAAFGNRLHPQPQAMAVGSARDKFPNDLLLVQFLRSAKRCAGQGPYIHDHFGFEKSFEELIADILRMRDLMRQQLPASVFSERGVFKDEAPYVAVLTRSGYEFIVAFFATRVLGGAPIPFGSGILPEEARYFVDSSKASCILAGKDCYEKAERIASLSSGPTDFKTIPIPIVCDSEPVKEIEVTIDETLNMDPRGPGLVIFTSGTTGPPKGAVLPRICIVFQPDAPANCQTICFRPPHWLGGAISLVEPMLTGKQVHILRERAGVENIWKVFRNNQITGTGFTPGVLREMKEWLEAQSEDEQEEYLKAFKRIGIIHCAGAMVSPSVLKFWKSRTGLVFNNVYGSTEVGGLATFKCLDGTERSDAIGVAFPGIKVKLTDGDHGEICVKSPFMLTHYIGDEEKTKAAFDAEGYFKTGDFAELKDGEYIFSGRANTDYILFRHYRIPSVQVEVALTALPYVTEACVLGVPDHEAKQICAAVVRLTREQEQLQSRHGERIIDLARLRADMNETLPKYMLPVLVKILGPGEEMPQTVSHKPIKNQIIKKCFGVEKSWSAENSIPGVEYWGSMPAPEEADTKLWDWLGLQRADFKAEA
ncbi:hypothetical protein TrVFT333_000159 [Trichoderma virens FT-333]|nr:hypothetical protein TrVFT333_000159 [Trichoderma virens FT-333]